MTWLLTVSMLTCTDLPPAADLGAAALPLSNADEAAEAGDIGLGHLAGQMAQQGMGPDQKGGAQQPAEREELMVAPPCMNAEGSIPSQEAASPCALWTHQWTSICDVSA